MKKTKSVEAILTQELKKGKTKGLHFFEIIYIFLMGLKDGRHGVPKINENKAWISSLMNKEKNEFEEYCDKKWGYLQIILGEDHKKCDVLMKEIPLLGKKLESAREKEKRFEPISIVRKRGEEELSDNQVLARRKREEAKKLAINHAEVARLEEELSNKYHELAEIHHHIVETTNMVRMICERVKHTNQLLDVYWRAVLRVHPEKDVMPMVVAELSKPQAEETYLMQHKGYEDAVEYVLSKYEKDVTEIRLRSIERNEEVA